MAPVFTLKGVQDTVEVFDSTITIKPRGVLGVLNKGMKGTKTIPFSSIRAIQLKEAGLFSNGYLQVTLSGGTESTRGLFAATKDENTFMFKKGDNELVRTIKAYIEDKLLNPGAPKSSGSLADELQKLASLRDQGIISTQEFDAAKRRLIG